MIVIGYCVMLWLLSHVYYNRNLVTDNDISAKKHRLFCIGKLVYELKNLCA